MAGRGAGEWREGGGRIFGSPPSWGRGGLCCARGGGPTPQSAGSGQPPCLGGRLRRGGWGGREAGCFRHSCGGRNPGEPPAFVRTADAQRPSDAALEGRRSAVDGSRPRDRLDSCLRRNDGKGRGGMAGRGRAHFRLPPHRGGATGGLGACVWSPPSRWGERGLCCARGGGPTPQSAGSGQPPCLGGRFRRGDFGGEDWLYGGRRWLGRAPAVQRERSWARRRGLGGATRRV